jgi:hypothetical protein
VASRTELIPGYDYGSVAPSPVTPHDLDLLKRSVLFTDEDQRYLRMAGDVLEDQVEDVLDLWYGFVGSHPRLVRYFAGPDGQPVGEYLAAVRKRFGQWILDTCRRAYDQAWLDYQHEIGLRHHRTKKNRTDRVVAADHIPARYLVAFIYPITATIEDFLSRKGHTREEVKKMHQAWFKAVTLQVALWLYPYMKEGDF